MPDFWIVWFREKPHLRSFLRGKGCLDQDMDDVLGDTSVKAERAWPDFVGKGTWQQERGWLGEDRVPHVARFGDTSESKRGCCS